LIYRQHASIRPRHLYESGNTVHGQAQLALARAQSFFGLLTVIDVCEEEIPGGDHAFWAAHRQAANLKPAIDAISASTAMLDVVQIPGLDTLLSRLDHAGKVIRMNGADQ